MDAWSKSNSFTFLIKNSIVVLEEIEAHNMKWKRWMMHDFEVAFITTLKHVAAFRNIIRLSIHDVVEVRKFVLSTIWALADRNNFKHALNVH